MRWSSLLLRLLLAVLLVPAVGLTLLRLLQPEPGVLVRTVSFAPVALVLYGLVLLVAFARAVFPGAGSARRWLALAVVAAVGTCAHGYWLAPEFSGEAPAPVTPSQSATVMSVNLLKGRADARLVVETAAQKHVDILVLQEVTPTALRQLERNGLEAAYPYRAGVPGKGTQGTMVFATTRIGNATKLDTHFDSWAVDVFRAEGSLRVYGVHTKPPLTDAEEWRADLKAIARAARADKELDLVVGDFNASSDHRAFQHLLDADLRSAAEVANSGWLPTWPDHGKFEVLGIPLPRVVQIDHVLVGRTMTAIGVETVEMDGSDHRAVIAEVSPADVPEADQQGAGQ